MDYKYFHMPAADTSARFLMQMIIADDFKSAYTDPYNKARDDMFFTVDRIPPVSRRRRIRAFFRKIRQKAFRR